MNERSRFYFTAVNFTFSATRQRPTGPTQLKIMAAQILVVDQAEVDNEDSNDAEPFDLEEERPKTADAQEAFRAAEAASAATASVISKSVKPEDLAAKLVGNDGVNVAEASPPPVCDRLATCHRLNEHFAACGSYEESARLVCTLCKAQPRLGEALVGLLVDGDALVELAVQLMHNLCMEESGIKMVLGAGALPVLAATLRADEPLMRAHGLALLAAGGQARVHSASGQGWRRAADLFPRQVAQGHGGWCDVAPAARDCRGYAAVSKGHSRSSA